MGEFQKTCSAKFEELKPATKPEKVEPLGTMIVERIDDPDTDRIIERCTRSNAMDYLQYMKDTFNKWHCKPEISGEHLLDGSVDLKLTHRSPSLNNLHFRFIPDGKPFKMVRKIKGVAQAIARLGEATKQFANAINQSK